MKVLVIDIGGNHVKLLATGRHEPRKFRSGRRLTPAAMVEGAQQAAAGWAYDVVAIGYPGVVVDDRPVTEPHNLGRGWVGFDYAAAFGKPVKMINDAAMQALGAWRGDGKMLFLGLGTGLGSAMVVHGHVLPMELAHLPYRDSTFEGHVGALALERDGRPKWRRRVADVVRRLSAALVPDEVVIGGGNARLLRRLPEGCRTVDNAMAFAGGFRLWAGRRRPAAAKRVRA
jgi:polyphosphate glucokinase